MPLDDSSIRRFRNLLLATAIMVYLLIVIGGIVRVTGSGLGCPDWPRCFGRWIPPLRADAIIEYTHRLVATLTSPLILASAVVAWWRFRAVRLATYPLLYAILLLAFQGLLGGVVVLLETPPNLVSVHLGIAFLIQALVIIPAVLTYLAPRLDITAARLIFDSRFARLARLTTVMVFLMLLSGAFVVGSNSTYACSGWPLCNGQLIPSNPMGYIHMAHRLMVLLASVHVLLLYLRARKTQFRLAANRAAALVLLIFFLLQAAVGALKVSFAFPILLLGLHVALASAVWGLMMVQFTLAGLDSQAS
jgi:heme A synthase